MKGYWVIIGSEISDAAAQAEYVSLWSPIAEKYNARVNPPLSQLALLEQTPSQRVVIVEFDTYDLAKACYEDPSYEVAKSFALKASNRTVLLIQADLSSNQ